ncbi:MAG: hypothetical protein FWH53_04790 [Leptospirales bacterium]|nr:hypothetical protein [Leptospirales bacterium]
MAKSKRLSEGKKDIIAALIQEYGIKTAADIQEALKDLLGGTLKEMLEAEMTEHLGYKEYERSNKSLFSTKFCLTITGINNKNESYNTYKTNNNSGSASMARHNIDGEEKNFVGIGKIMIDTKPSITWNIPHLHFLVLSNLDYFEAICLEFGLVSSGETQEEAAKRLVELIIYHIGAVMDQGGGFEEFKEIALNDFMNDFWSVYRHIEFTLAETKQDLSHEIMSQMTKAIQETFDTKVKEHIAAKAKETADEIIKEYEKMTAFTLNSVTYASLESVA